MTARTPERHKKPGVCYAWTDDGLELPIIDVTHPAFAEDEDPASVDRVIQEAMKGRPGIRFLGLTGFAELARQGGWAVTAARDEAVHHVVRLDKAR